MLFIQAGNPLTSFCYLQDHGCKMVRASCLSHAISSIDLFSLSTIGVVKTTGIMTIQLLAYTGCSCMYVHTGT